MTSAQFFEEDRSSTIFDNVVVLKNNYCDPLFLKFFEVIKGIKACEKHNHRYIAKVAITF